MIANLENIARIGYSVWTMKIVLLKDAKNVGKKHDVKVVADGFALNSLIPQGVAEVATAKALARVEAIKKQEEAERKVRADLLAKNLKSLHDAEVTVTADANEKGHLFAGLHGAEIAPLVKEQTRIDVLPEFIVLEKPIKEVGNHKIDVKVQGQTATFTLHVKAK
jgi:large subunit ribosomal protein L9